MTGKPPPEAQKTIDTIKAHDGFEHIYTLGNGGEGLVITVWRDKATAEAAKERAFSTEAQARRAELGQTLLTTRPTTLSPNSEERTGIIVPVAQVLKVSGMTLGARPPEVQKMGDAVKAMDGFEHMYLLGNSEGGLVIQVWQDKAALEAKREQTRATNPSCPAWASTSPLTRCTTPSRNSDEPMQEVSLLGRPTGF
jgi:heme-degrading monooxygenase HmoA